MLRAQLIPGVTLLQEVSRGPAGTVYRAKREELELDVRVPADRSADGSSSRLQFGRDAFHDTRWNLPLPSREATLAHMEQTLERVLERLAGRMPSKEEAYFHCLAAFHEDMHAEAFLYTRQTLGYPPPKSSAAPSASIVLDSPRGDAEVPGGRFDLGAPRTANPFPFVFDNEKWAHPVDVAPFGIARTPVTEGEFLAFVNDTGYERPSLWSEVGWDWRLAAQAGSPLYWRPDGNGGWVRRLFDRDVPIETDLPMIHVNAFEAEAYCRWARRRLPTESEWELASGGFEKSAFPWGDEPPSLDRANVDGWARVAVGGRPSCDSPFGCRQMVGNVWEWTASAFGPYPGFVRDPYAEYSEPWFGTHRVLRGGCFATRGPLLRNTGRNFYTPDRRDVFAGFRTCASAG